MAKILFFGYGANSDINRISEILKKKPEGGQGAFLDDYCLAVQNLSQIPPTAQQVLKKIWGDSFHAYTIRKESGYRVEGRIWEIEEEDLEKIKQFEFVGEKNWRELLTTQVKTSDGKVISVITEKCRDVYLVEKTVDGILYEPNLNPEGKHYYSKEDEYRIESLREEIRVQLAGNYAFMK